jgi:hypothetical protein
VGEVEIAYEPTSLVKIDGVAASPADLAVGQVVEVVARGRGNELGAREIAVQHIVGGPITRVSSDGSDIDVIGQRVRLTPATRGDDPSAGRARLAVGEFVRVSGMRDADGTIVASRVALGGDEVARLAGPVDGVGPGMIAVAGTPVVVPERLELSAGDEIRVAGSWDGDRLVASSVEPLPRLPFGGRVARVDVEGYARVSAAGELRVGPYRFAGSSDAVAAVSDLDPRTPVRVEVSVRDGRAVIERIDSVPNLPPRPDARDARGPGHWDGGDRGARDDFNTEIDARPPREGRGGMPDGARGPADVGSGPPDRPARPVDVRPPIDARPPERPPHAGPPPIDRPELPARPERPPRPGRP